MGFDIITLENPLIKKELHLKDKRIVSYTVYNKLSSKIFTPNEDSEEFCIYFNRKIGKKAVPCSSLKVEKLTEENNDTNTVYRIYFKPFSLKDSKIRTVLVYTVNAHRCYMRKHLEFSFEKKGNKETVLDRIEFEKIKFESSLKFWTLPEQKNSHISGFALSLGQPVYLDSLYMGSEFPASLNKIENYTATVTYYSGRTLHELIGSDKYITNKSVLGGGESDIYQPLQKAFFEYIKDISKPIRLRRQYNSWYDNMLNITRENVYNSFLEIDKGLTATGEPPLDSFVADDGWNDYSKGFWSFNEKFPDELYPFKNLAKSLGSDFGLWVGPRGGYTTDTPKFAKAIEKAGNGYFNRSSGDICVASEKYVKRMKEMMTDFERKFSLDYFKLDGFAQKPCKNKHHDHLTGGYKDMYFYSDTWEKWLEVFEELSLGGGSNFWINLTCYAPPSPWFLQWVNSLWIQISDDMGFVGKKGAVSDKDRLLSYRDERYLDFYQVRQFQFPQRALYNHDPIYASEAKISMTDEEFRSYLFTMAARGTSFWELYYSYSMMTESKWRINYSALRFIEDNLDVLSNSVIFGGRPSESSVYGYSCFADYEGIVCLRNSSSESRKFTFRLDEIIGVKKEFKIGRAVTVLPYTAENGENYYSYGDTVTVNLLPFETRIIHFGKKSKPMKAEYVKARSENTLEVQFNQSVVLADINCKEKEIENAVLLEDYMTVLITFKEPFSKMNRLTLSSVGDILGNKSDVEVTFDCHEKYAVKEGGLYGKTDFTITANINTAEPTVLFKQGSEVELFVGSDGFVRFKVGAYMLKSLTDIKDVVQVTAVRERNNVLKLYLNKELSSGMPSGVTELSGESYETGEGVNVQVLSRALKYDEV